MNGGQLELKDVIEAVRSRRRWITGGLLARLLPAGLLGRAAERTYRSTSEPFIPALAPLTPQLLTRCAGSGPSDAWRSA